MSFSELYTNDQGEKIDVVETSGRMDIIEQLFNSLEVVITNVLEDMITQDKIDASQEPVTRIEYIKMEIEEDIVLLPTQLPSSMFLRI